MSIHAFYIHMADCIVIKPRTDTQDKSPELKTAYWKSPVVSVYINSKFNWANIVELKTVETKQYTLLSS